MKPNNGIVWDCQPRRFALRLPAPHAQRYAQNKMKTIFSRLQNKNEALKIIKYTALFNLIVGCFSVLWALTSDKMYLLDA
jgi:hypothetical protein